MKKTFLLFIFLCSTILGIKRTFRSYTKDQIQQYNNRLIRVLPKENNTKRSHFRLQSNNLNNLNPIFVIAIVGSFVIGSAESASLPSWQIPCYKNCLGCESNQCVTSQSEMDKSDCWQKCLDSL